MNTTPVHFPNLDGIRAFACLSVFVAHVFDYLNNRTLGNFEGWMYDHVICGAGAMGVSLFFVLSGFLITTLLLQEKNKTGRISLRFFYMKRVLRIWPLFLLVNIAGFFIVPMIGHFYDAEITRAHLPWFLTFTNNIDRVITGFSGTGNDSLGVLWSVAVEEQFYLLWPLIILLLNRKFFPYAALIIVVGSACFRFLHSDSSGALFYHSFSVAGDLAVGGLVAFLSVNSTRFVNYFRNIKTPVRMGIYLWILCTMAAHRYLLNTSYMIVPGRILLTLAFGVLVADQCFGPQSRLSAERIPGLTRIGLISYGFYCYHMFVIMIFQKMNSTYFPGAISTAVFYCELSGAFLLTLALSLLSHRYFENFFMKMRTRFKPGYMNSDQL